MLLFVTLGFLAGHGLLHALDAGGCATRTAAKNARAGGSRWRKVWYRPLERTYVVAPTSSGGARLLGLFEIAVVVVVAAALLA